MDKVEIRLRVLEAVAHHCSAREWNDVDILAEKVRILSDFVLDQRSISTLKKTGMREPNLKLKSKIPA
mgnify:CR=1 FL=1